MPVTASSHIIRLFHRNRLSLRYINIATTRYNAGATTQPSPKGKKEKIEKKKTIWEAARPAGLPIARRVCTVQETIWYYHGGLEI
jgi:hypothetical protein